MAKLKPEVKRFIVQQLAQYFTPTQVQRAVKVEFNVTVSLPQVIYYDPTKGAEDKSLDDGLRELFAATREKFRRTEDEHAIVDRGYRLGRLQRLSEAAEQAGNIPLAAQLIEQAAKDAGGVFTNRREITGKNGRDLIPILNVTLNAEPEASKEADDSVSEQRD